MKNRTDRGFALPSLLLTIVVAVGGVYGTCDPEPQTVICTWDSDCLFGFECGAGGSCVESECHEADPNGALAALSCPSGLGCEYSDGVDWNHGNGQCVPTGCTFNTECPFGFMCSGLGCVESECHEADPNGTLAALSCPAGLACEYGDGVDWNHGNGYCVVFAVPGDTETYETW